MSLPSPIAKVWLITSKVGGKILYLHTAAGPARWVEKRSLASRFPNRDAAFERMRDIGEGILEGEAI